VARDYSKEIARLEKLLSSGVTSVTTDGVTTSYDLDVVRSRLAELKRLQSGKGKISTLGLRGCW